MFDVFQPPVSHQTTEHLTLRIDESIDRAFTLRESRTGNQSNKVNTSSFLDDYVLVCTLLTSSAYSPNNNEGRERADDADFGTTNKDKIYKITKCRHYYLWAPTTRKKTGRRRRREHTINIIYVFYIIKPSCTGLLLLL